MNGELAAALGIGMLILGIVGQAIVLSRWLAATLRTMAAENRAEVAKVYALVETRSNEYDGRLAELRNLHTKFELEVSKYYASDDRLQQMEAKFTVAIEKLINRFDTFATDFNKIVGRMERANQESGRG